MQECGWNHGRTLRVTHVISYVYLQEPIVISSSSDTSPERELPLQIDQDDDGKGQEADDGAGGTPGKPGGDGSEVSG